MRVNFKGEKLSKGLFRVFTFLILVFLILSSSSFPSVYATDYDLSNSSDYDFSVQGATDGDLLGAVDAVAVGDVNDDGIDDLVVGSYKADNGGTNNGSVWVIFGGSTLSGDKPLSTSSNYNIRFDAPFDSDNLSRNGSINIADVNGDGKNELILGAYLGDSNGSNSGTVWVLFPTLLDDYNGTTGNNLDLGTGSNYNIRYDGTAGSCLGMRRGLDETTSDINGDGTDDLILGAPSADNGGSSNGSVYVIFSTLIDDITGTGNVKSLETEGNYNIRFDGASDSDFLPDALGTGDLNGDGKDDLVMSSGRTDYNSTTDGGSAWVVFSTFLDDYDGSTGNNLSLGTGSNYNIRYDGTNTSELTRYLGIEIGDVNGDGNEDLVLGGKEADTGETDGGAAWVMYSTLIDDVGSTTGNNHYLDTSGNYSIRYDGESAGDNITENGAIRIGDLNGDSKGDLVLGSLEYSGDRGAVWIMFSTLVDDNTGTGNVKSLGTASSYNARYNSTSIDDYMTQDRMIKIADVDNDGADDLLVGAPYGASDKGELWVILSSTFENSSGTGNNYEINSNYDNYYVGSTTSNFMGVDAGYNLGDLNDDGANDLILTNRGDDGNGTDAGAVMVLYGTLPNVAPDVPSSLGPSSLVDGSYTSDSTPTLEFTLSDGDAGDTVKYQIQIDDDSDFSSPAVDYTSALDSQGSFSFTVGQAAGSGSYATGSEGQTLSDGEYYWRVKAIDDSDAVSSYTTANSGSIAFKVDITSPSVPSSITPSSTPTNDTTPTWSWTGSTDSGSGLAATPYTVQWCDNDSFTDCGGNTDTSSTTSYTHTSVLSDGTWYLRVKTEDALGHTSSYSSHNSVLVDSVSPSIPTDVTPPSSVTHDPTPTWSWSASADSGSGLAATPYTVQWCRESDFSNCASNTDTSSTTSYTHTSNLSDGSWYLRVKASDAAGNDSSYSASNHLTLNRSGVSVGRAAPVSLSEESQGTSGDTGESEEESPSTPSGGESGGEEDEGSKRRTSEEIRAEIERIRDLIKEFQMELMELTGLVARKVSNIPSHFSFKRSLRKGMKGEDVKYLQIVLNSDPDTILAGEGIGSPGEETEYFGLLTEKAVIRFQEKYAEEVLAPWDLSHGTGYVGGTTFEKLNEILAK